MTLLLRVENLYVISKLLPEFVMDGLVTSLLLAKYMSNF